MSLNLPTQTIVGIRHHHWMHPTSPTANYGEVKFALFPEDSMKTDRILEQLSYMPSQLAQRPVLIYMPQGLQGLKPGFQEFQQQKCLVQNCFITTDRKGRRQADVVYFRQGVSRMGKPNGQLWVLQLLESPVHTSSLVSANNLINYTATYRWDSDIVTPYERWTPSNMVPDDQKLSPHLLLQNKPNYAQGKSKQAVIFVSHCQTNNNRLLYAKQLSNHMSVDIGGSCGQFQCNRRDAQCWQTLNNHYKFYLSFENSNCKDYVTEKFFVNGLQYNVIPIVMGAEKSYYEKIAPPKSFIHVDDFESAAELAKYLKYLDGNDTAFNEYMAWKDSGGQFINTKFWCRLCALVQIPRHKIHSDISAWWMGPGVCSSSRSR